MGHHRQPFDAVAREAGVPFDVATLFAASEQLRPIGERGARAVVAAGYATSFQDAVR